MPTTVPENQLHVVVGILKNDDGKVLVQQRTKDRVCGGQWEFPGGKVERSESAEQALFRELKEELGIEIQETQHLMDLSHQYSHAHVWLQIYLVGKFDGEVVGREGQSFDWHDGESILRLPLLEAVFPILDKLNGLKGYWQ